MGMRSQKGTSESQRAALDQSHQRLRLVRRSMCGMQVMAASTTPVEMRPELR